MGPRGVVFGDTGGDQVAGIDEVAQQGLVEKFVQPSTVEALDEAILLRLTRRNVMQFDVVLGAALRDRFQA